MLTKQRKVVKTGHPAGHIGWTKYLQQGCSWIVIPCFDAMVQSLPLKAVLVAAGAIGFGHLFDPVLSFAFSPLSNFVSQPSCARSTFAAASRGESDICRRTRRSQRLTPCAVRERRGIAHGARGGGLRMEQEALILTEDNVIAVISEAKTELRTLFGNNAENTAVGITGDVEFVCLDGPSVVVRLTGRFWHERTTVLSRVGNFILSRIPECIDVEIEDPSQLEDADPQGRGQGADL